MKLQPDQSDAQTISGIGPGWIAVNGDRIQHSAVIASSGERLDWNAAGFDALGEAHFEQVAALDVEVVIFGSGARLRFPRPAWLRPLIGRGIGVETMDTAAACRTYNILAQEGRRVAAALLVEPAP